MRNREKWRKALEEWELSGESQAGFCRERNLSLSSFQYYKSIFGKESPQSEFVEIGGEESIEFIVSEKLTVRVPSNTSSARIAELAECLS